MFFRIFNPSEHSASVIYKKTTEFKAACGKLPKDYPRGRRKSERIPVIFEVCSKDRTRGVIMEVGEYVEFYLLFKDKRHAVKFEVAIQAITNLTATALFVRHLPKDVQKEIKLTPEEKQQNMLTVVARQPKSRTA